MLQRIRSAWPLAVAVAIEVILVARPLFATGYVGDDQANSLQHWTTKFLGINTWQGISEQLDFWVFTEGRLYPLSTMQSLQFDILHDLVAYKLVLLAWVLASTLAVGLILIRMGLGNKAAALVLVIAATLFQFRAYNDPIVSFAGLVPAMLIAIAFSVFLFQGWLRTGGKRQLAGSICLYIVAALTYESAYPFFLLMVALAVIERQGWKERFRAARPIMAPALVLFVAAGILRLRAPVGGEGIYQPNFSVGPVVGSAVDQLSASLPLTYPLFNLDTSFSPRWSTLVWQMGWIPLAVGVAVAAASLVLMSGREVFGGGQRRATVELATLGLLMWFLAALPIAIAPRYQGDLSFGLGHLPVYVQYFGVAMCAMAALRLLLGFLVDRVPHAERTVVASVALLLGLLSALTFRANEITANVLSPIPERTALATALGDGLLADAPDGSAIGPIPAAAWQQGSFYLRYAGRRYVLADIGAPQTAPVRTGCTPKSPSTWLVRSGALEIGDFAISSCRTTDGPAPAVLWLEGAGPTRVILSANLLPKRPGAEPEAFMMPLVMQRTASGRIARFVPPRGLDLFTLVLQPYAGAAAITLRSGCGPLVAAPDGASNVCRAGSVIGVTELVGADQTVDLDFGVATESQEGQPLSISKPCSRALRVGPTVVPVHCRLHLRPRETVMLRVRSRAPKVRLVNFALAPTL